MPGFIGMPELLLLGLVVLVLFGPKRLPEMGRGLGKGMREFKHSITGDGHAGELETATPEVITTVDDLVPTVEEVRARTVEMERRAVRHA